MGLDEQNQLSQDALQKLRRAKAFMQAINRAYQEFLEQLNADNSISKLH
jgi:hypothetical protein